MKLKSIVLAIVSLIVAAGSGPTLEAAPSEALRCGGVAEAGGAYHLEQDLNCSGPNFATALFIQAGSKVNMRGHTLTCAARNLAAFKMESDAMLMNGSIDNCAIGVAIGNAERATVRNLTVTGAKFGVLVNGGGHHKFNDIQIDGAGYTDAFLGINLVATDHNSVIDNHVTGYRSGISIGAGSDENRVIGNVGSANNIGAGSANAGIIVNSYASRNSIKGNVTRDNRFGILAVTIDAGVSPHNLIQGNEMLDNWEADAFAGSHSMGIWTPGTVCINQWRGNEFLTSSGPMSCID